MEAPARAPSGLYFVSPDLHQPSPHARIADSPSPSPAWTPGSSATRTAARPVSSCPCPNRKRLPESPTC